MEIKKNHAFQISKINFILNSQLTHMLFDIFGIGSDVFRGFRS